MLTANSSLYEQLLELRVRVRSMLSPQKLEIIDAQTSEIERSGLLARMLKPGDPAPEFELPDTEGRPVRSRDLLERGPLVVSFFRGRWDPYCNTELEAWQAQERALSEIGATLVAISPQLPRQNGFAKSERGLRFPLLSDAGNHVARQFGLVYRFTPEMQELYRAMYTLLPRYNGDDSWELPVPATFAIRRDGTITFAEGHADYTRRPEPASVLRGLKASG